MVGKKIKATKDNKSPRVDEIPSRLLMEQIEQISIPLARVINRRSGFFSMKISKHNAII